MQNQKEWKRAHNFRQMPKKIFLITVLLLVLAGCKSVKEGFFTKQTPYEEYHCKIVNAGLDKNKVGQNWINAGRNVLTNPLKADVPFSEALIFDDQDLAAAGYLFSLKEGQNLQVVVEPEQDDTSAVFIDLFREDTDGLKQVEHAEKDSLNLSHKIRRDGDYIVRIQPELLTSGLFVVYIFTDASLDFPVPGKSYRSISSFFGDPRDGGSRQHKGVDIFASRGTPALAVASGRISRTGTNRLGGKVVWLSDNNRGYNYYYAHLDSQLVQPGTQVQPGRYTWINRKYRKCSYHAPASSFWHLCISPEKY